MKKSLLTLIFLLAIASFVNAQVPARTGWWKFDDISDLGKAEVGNALIVNGNITSVDGPKAGNLAVEVPVGSYFTCDHGIAPNGGGTLVNEYSIMWDFSIPATETWYAFLETSSINSDDADLFIAATANTGISRVPNSIGTGSLLYTANTVSADAWYRLIISAKNGEFFKIYVNGELWPVSADLQSMLTQDVDSRYGLAPQIFFFQDGDGDDGKLKCSEISMWDVALTAENAQTLGDATTVLTRLEPKAKAGELLQSYPNPCSTSTTFSYNLKNSQEVTLHIFDVTGREVSSVKQGFQLAGQHTTLVNTANLSSGTYFVRLNTNSTINTHKMMVK